MKNSAFILFLMFVASVETAGTVLAQNLDQAGDLIQYKDIYSEQKIVVDQKQKSILGGDIWASYETCQAESGYICVSSQTFHFAVPTNKSHLKVGDHWIYKKVRYEFRAARKVKILGREYEVLIIRCNYGNLEALFYYSYDAGLLAIGTYGGNGNPPTMFLLEGNIGLAPASPSQSSMHQSN